MNKEQEQFYAICLLSVYMYLKNRYSKLNELSENDFDSNVNNINNMLLKVEKYAYIPDQERLVEKSYEEIVGRIVDKTFNEGEFFKRIGDLIENLNNNEKEYILNSIFHIAYDDKKISDKEKKLIIQVAHLLGLDTDFEKIMKSFQKSEFIPSVSNKIVVIIFIFILLFLFLIIGIYTYYNNSKNDINLFDKKRIVFSEISFNRFVVYKNKFNISNQHYQKQAIFDITGKAEIEFKPENILYNNIRKTLTILYTDKIFQVTSVFNPYLVVDKVNPKPISESEANKLGAIVGVVGAVVGAKAGNSIGKMLPPPYSLVAVGGGAVLGGATGYFVTSTALKGMSLSAKISKSEEQTVVQSAQGLISWLLANDENLQNLYKKRFEKYIRFKYSAAGIIIDDIEYKEIKK